MSAARRWRCGDRSRAVRAVADDLAVLAVTSAAPTSCPSELGVALPDVFAEREHRLVDAHAQRILGARPAPRSGPSTSLRRERSIATAAPVAVVLALGGPDPDRIREIAPSSALARSPRSCAFALVKSRASERARRRPEPRGLSLAAASLPAARLARDGKRLRTQPMGHAQRHLGTSCGRQRIDARRPTKIHRLPDCSDAVVASPG